MADKFWLQDGDVIVNAEGEPILCETDPCAEVPENSCNSCDPAIPDTLYATFSGLSGDFADWNGKNAINWAVFCQWRGGDYPGGKFLQLSYAGTLWSMFVRNNSGGFDCWKWFQSNPGHGCAPWNATYSEHDCDDGDCDDGSSCNDSAGATCVVSLT